MKDSNDQYIIELIKKMETLFAKQQSLSKEMEDLRKELYNLQGQSNIVAPPTVQNPPLENIEKATAPIATIPAFETYIEQKKDADEVVLEGSNKAENIPEPTPTFQPTPKVIPTQRRTEMSKSALEKFIGENLISKIGIIITLIGISIGVKYSIDHELISPLARVILGYVASIALLVTGFRLKEKYASFSAVLVSGAMAATYFITFTAFSFYGLFPRSLTFVLMFLFTAFTVFSAIQYNKQIIAHIGLVGAYAIPFLLNDNSGNIAGFYTYVAIINIGILTIAFLRKWQSLFYASFVITWLIVLAETILDGKQSLINTNFLFSTVFFLLFYVMFLVSTIRKGALDFANVAILLVNSFVYYGIGYALISQQPTYEKYVGLFTVVNGLVHFIAALFIYKKQLADKKIMYLLLGLVLVFITIAIPVQLDGNWVTLIWIAEAVVLFGVGSKKNIIYYERMSHPLMILAFFSLVQDWDEGYDHYYGSKVLPTIINVYFLTSVMVIAGFFLIHKWQKEKISETTDKKLIDRNAMMFIVPTILLIVLYLTPFLEINNWFTNQSKLLKIQRENAYQSSLISKWKSQEIIWLINYSCLFFTLLTYWNFKKGESRILGIFAGIASILTIVVFLVTGLVAMGDLLDGYMNSYVGGSFLLLRYLTFGFVALLIWVNYQYWKKDTLIPKMESIWRIALSFLVLIILSNELIQWMRMAGSESEYKLGLSILWGCYALSLIGYGIGKQLQYYRIMGIALFAITLLKVFFYDIAYMSTISKTILFVILGVLLLIVSFLYNKYNGKISDGE